MTEEERQLPPDSGHLDPATASGWLEADADPVGRGWQPPRQSEDRPRRSASAEAAAIRLFDLEQ